MQNFDLFVWWAISISGGSIFLTIVSIYLYLGRKPHQKERIKTARKIGSIAKDFIFVWILLSLLVFYIISINIGSEEIFAAGNIIVEAILVAYLLKSKKEKSE